jgi:hypothetical protein
MLRLMILASMFLFASVCEVDHRGKQRNLSHATPKMSPETHQEKFNIENTVGVVVLNKFVKGDFVRFYNRDGSLWYEFSYFYDDSDGKFDYANDDFRPFAFHVDNFLLVLKCTNQNGKLLEVIVNEDTGMAKYVKADDPILKLQTWDAHVVSVLSVTFDKKGNPLREAPDGQVKKVTVPGDVYFRPVETDGDWLKVRWELEDGKSKNDRLESNGWIRWKHDGILLIDFVYFS